MPTTQRKLRIEVYDESGSVRGDDYAVNTVAAVEVILPGGTEVPGECLIEAARLAYQHVTGADFREIVEEG